MSETFTLHRGEVNKNAQHTEAALLAFGAPVIRVRARQVNEDGGVARPAAWAYQ